MIKLNLGSGADLREGFVNVDIAPVPGVDVVHDLDVAPWPWPDGSVGLILALDIFEHVADAVLFMRESGRVLCDLGELCIRTSYWKNENAYTDPTHRRFCTEQTFDYWIKGEDAHRRHGAAYSPGLAFGRLTTEMAGQELSVRLLKLPAEPA